MTVLVVGGPGQTAAAAQELAGAAVADVLTLEDAALATYTPDGYTAALQRCGAAFAGRRGLPHTYRRRDFAPKLATRLNRALLTDVTATRAMEGGRTAYARPMFQGKLTANVVAE